MNKLTVMMIAALLALLFSAQAQASETETSEANAETSVDSLSPVEITPEQKIEARRDIQKAIQTTAVNSSPEERRKIIDAVETLKKIKIRRENISKTSEEKINYQAPEVNAKDRKEVQNYLQKTFVEPLDSSFASPNQEQK